MHTDMETLKKFIMEECERHILFDHNPERIAFKWFRCWHSIELIEGKFVMRYWDEAPDQIQPENFFEGEDYKQYADNEIKVIYEILMEKSWFGNISVNENWWKLLADNGMNLMWFKNSKAKQYE